MGSNGSHRNGGRVKSRRRSAVRHATLWLLLGLLAGGLAAPAQAEPATKVDLDPIANRLMTWNTGGQSQSAIVEQVSNFRPQIVALQETCWESALAARRWLERSYDLEYQILFGFSGPSVHCTSRQGTAFLVAEGLPVRNVNRKGYSEDEGPLEARGIHSFSTRIDGRWFRIFNTHLSAPWEEPLRIKQARELAAKVQPYRRAILLGDLNTRPWHTHVLDPVWRLGLGDVDPFCVPGAEGDARKLCNKTLPKTVDSKYDYILHRGINSRHCRLHTPTDDHRVVISDVTRAQGPRPACTVT